MTPARLSVLLPCRDAGEYLSQAIRSLTLQTFQDFEVVAVNDGSRDETCDILQRWATRDRRVRIIQSGGSGLAAALEVGARACSGELIARVDADDFAHPRRFSEQLAFLAARPRVAAVGTHIRYFPHEAVGLGARRYQGWLNGLSEPESLARDLFVECPIAHPTLTIRRSALAAVGGYRANGWPEDYDLLMRLHTAGAQLANVPRVLHFWRERAGRASRSDRRYTTGSFRRCKVHYLRECCLEGRSSLHVWGAGRVGKDFARVLLEDGLELQGFIDIDPRKIGQEIYGVPVRGSAAFDLDPSSYLVVAVGTAGSRGLIRSWLDSAGLREPEDYRCVA